MSTDVQHFRLKMGAFCTLGLENRACYLEEVFPRLTPGDIRNLSLMFMVEQLGKLWWQRKGGGEYQFGEIPPENTSKGKLRENDSLQRETQKLIPAPPDTKYIFPLKEEKETSIHGLRRASPIPCKLGFTARPIERRHSHDTTGL